MFPRTLLTTARSSSSRLFSSASPVGTRSSQKAFAYAAGSALALTVGYNYLTQDRLALGRLGGFVHLDGPTPDVPPLAAHPDIKANPNVSRDAKPSSNIEPAAVSSSASTMSRSAGGEKPTKDITEIPQKKSSPSEKTKTNKPSSGIEPAAASSSASTMSRVGGEDKSAPVRKEKKPEGKKSEKIAAKDEAGVSPEESKSTDAGGEEDKSQQAAYNEETGEINWDCPCLGGMAHGPCGPDFREAFSCFVHSEQEPKGVECVEKFKAMQDCFRAHPEVYGEEIADDDEYQESHGADNVNAQQAEKMGHLEEEAKKTE